MGIWLSHRGSYQANATPWWTSGTWEPGQLQVFSRIWPGQRGAAAGRSGWSRHDNESQGCDSAGGPQQAPPVRCRQWRQRFPRSTRCEPAAEHVCPAVPLRRMTCAEIRANAATSSLGADCADLASPAPSAPGSTSGRAPGWLGQARRAAVPEPGRGLRLGHPRQPPEARLSRLCGVRLLRRWPAGHPVTFGGAD